MERIFNFTLFLFFLQTPESEDCILAETYVNIMFELVNIAMAILNDRCTQEIKSESFQIRPGK